VIGIGTEQYFGNVVYRPQEGILPFYLGHHLLVFPKIPDVDQKEVALGGAEKLGKNFRGDYRAVDHPVGPVTFLPALFKRIKKERFQPFFRFNTVALLFWRKAFKIFQQNFFVAKSEDPQRFPAAVDDVHFGIPHGTAQGRCVQHNLQTFIGFLHGAKGRIGVFLFPPVNCFLELYDGADKKARNQKRLERFKKEAAFAYDNKAGELYADNITRYDNHKVGSQQDNKAPASGKKKDNRKAQYKVDRHAAAHSAEEKEGQGEKDIAYTQNGYNNTEGVNF
jgi:hypothetical protein